MCICLSTNEQGWNHGSFPCKSTDHFIVSLLGFISIKQRTELQHHRHIFIPDILHWITTYNVCEMSTLYFIAITKIWRQTGWLSQKQAKSQLTSVLLLSHLMVIANINKLLSEIKLGRPYSTIH